MSKQLGKETVMKYGNLTLGQVEAIVNKLGGEEGAMKLLRGETIISSPPRPTFSVIVNYNRTFTEMIKAGRYDWQNENITEKNFPVDGSSEKEIEAVLFHFNRFVRAKEVIAEVKRAGYRPARIEDLLALGEARPELQREFPVVALGSVGQDPYGDRRAPCLWGGGDERSLCLFLFEDGWDGYFRFLAVRES